MTQLTTAVNAFDTMMRQAVRAIGRRPAFQHLGNLRKAPDDYSEMPVYTDNADQLISTTGLFEPNLVSSKLDHEKGPQAMHAPAIDLDFPAYLVESSTPGHFHLYLEREVPLDKYLKVLEAMMEAGLVERGFYNAAVSRKATFLRLPGDHK
jgi:hypothetical protein